MTELDCKDPAERLVGSVWRLQKDDGTLLAPVVQLLSDGMIGGHVHNFHRRWNVRNGHLQFLDADGIMTTIFDDLRIVEGSIVGCAGHIRTEPSIKLQLHRITLPTFRETETLHGGTMFLESIDRPRRDHLVVICANAASLHTTWPKDIDDADRNWDLCVTRYDLDVLPTEAPYEYLAHQPKAPKYTAIYNLFYPGSPLWNYKYIWLPDDDLMTSWRGINRMFEICRRHQMLLAQPSLVPNCNVNHFITQQDPQFAFRFTKFVEIMCPIFSRESLETCLPTFQATNSAYGLDHIWPRLLGGICTRFAIIDSVSVAHTRPLGKHYDVRRAIEEGLHMQRLYGAPASYTTVGCVLQSEAELI